MQTLRFPAASPNTQAYPLHTVPKTSANLTATAGRSKLLRLTHPQACGGDVVTPPMLRTKPSKGGDGIGIASHRSAHRMLAIHRSLREIK